MKNLILTCFVLSSAISFSQNNEWKNKYNMRWENFDGGVKCVIDNDNLLPITLYVGYELTNLTPEPALGTYVVIPASTKNYLALTLTKIDKSKGYNTKNGKTLLYKGDLTDVTYDDKHIYQLPFEKGGSFAVSQGYNGKISHQNEKAIDFDMPVNTKILAARDGLVVETMESNDKNCNSPSCASFNNYIQILHDDGTIMEYLHFRKNGVKVKPGQRVLAGELIGYSGNVGWSTGPHLHIELYLIDKNNKKNKLGIIFKLANKKYGELKEKETYLRDY
ncbi:MAG: M23 family metallopeptidase [Nonlabens sp.]|nr:M23 family metallopeptidase [Nonlabens sp.]